MKETTEVRIGGGNNLIVLKDNAVKSNILPEKQSELSRNVTVQGNVAIDGGVFANQLEIEDGPAEFKGAVYTSSELHIKKAGAGAVIFRKAIASAGVVSAFLTSGRALFGADINAQTVRLKNCYVGGSVYGTEVELENCVVLGGAFASKKLSMSNVMVGTFHAPEVDLAGTNYLLYPTAFSVEPMIALPGTELYSLSLADLGSLFKGDPEQEGSGKIRMDLKEDAQRTVLVDEEGANILVNSYSVATRVLVADLADPEKLENHFLLKAGALGTQLQKVYTLPKADGSRSAELMRISFSGYWTGQSRLPTLRVRSHLTSCESALVTLRCQRNMTLRYRHPHLRWTQRMSRVRRMKRSNLPRQGSPCPIRPMRSARWSLLCPLFLLRKSRLPVTPPLLTISPSQGLSRMTSLSNRNKGKRKKVRNSAGIAVPHWPLAPSSAPSVGSPCSSPTRLCGGV